MGGHCTWRFTLVAISFVLACVASITYAQKDPVQPAVPKQPPPGKDAKPDKLQLKAALPPASEEAEEGAEEPPQAAKAATGLPPVAPAATIGNVPKNDSSKSIPPQLPTGSKSVEKPLHKATVPPNEQEGPDSTEVTDAPPTGSVSPKFSVKPLGKATVPPASQESVEVTDAAPGSTAVPQKATKPGEKLPPNAAVPTATQASVEEEEITDALLAVTQVPKSPKPVTPLRKSSVPPAPASPLPPDLAEVFEAVPSGSPIPKGVKTATLRKVTLPPDSQEGAEDGGASGDGELGPDQAPPNSKPAIGDLGGASKSKNGTADLLPKNLPKATSPKPLVSAPPKAPTSDEAAEGDLDNTGESGDEVAQPPTPKNGKGTTPKLPKGPTTPKAPTSDEGEEEEAPVPGGGEPPAPGLLPSVPKANPSAKVGVQIPTLLPNNGKPVVLPNATPRAPQAPQVNVPGGPSFQPLEGGAVPPVLARANLAAPLSASARQQPAKPLVPTKAGPILTTPPVQESEEASSEEVVEESGSGDPSGSGIVAAVNAEYGAALRNLTQAGVLAESEYQNKHLSDLFALLLENLINTSPATTEKDQRQLVHRAAVDFQQIFKAKAASTKNVSEIVRLLNEQILASPTGGGGQSQGLLGTAGPFDPAAQASVAGNGTVAKVGGANFATPPPWTPTGPEGQVGIPAVDENAPGAALGGNAIQTVHLLQNANVNGQNKSVLPQETKNASVNEEKGNFPMPPTWKLTPALPLANATESGEVASGDGSEEVNGTIGSGSEEKPAPVVPVPGSVPTAEPTSVAQGSKVSPEPGPVLVNGSVTKQAPVPVAEPKPTAEPSPSVTALVGSTVAAAPVGSIEVTLSPDNETAETEGSILENNSSSTTIVPVPEPSSVGSSVESHPPTSAAPSASSSQPPVPEPTGNGSTESFWQNESQSPNPEPSPAATTVKEDEAAKAATPAGNVVLPWSFKIVDPQTEWDSELANKESFQFKTLYGSLTSDLKTMFAKLDPERFIGVSIKRFSQGSVVVEGETELKERVESGQLLENFLRLLKDQENKIGGRIVDPITVTFDGRPSSELARAGTGGINGTPTWVIGLAVGGVLLAAIVIAAALIVVRLLRNRRSSPSGSAIAETIKSGSPQHPRLPPPNAKRGSSASSTGYDTYASRSDYYRFYQPPYVAPGAVVRTVMAPPNYYSPYYQQHPGSYAYW